MGRDWFGGLLMSRGLEGRDVWVGAKVFMV